MYTYIVFKILHFTLFFCLVFLISFFFLICRFITLYFLIKHVWKTYFALLFGLYRLIIQFTLPPFLQKSIFWNIIFSFQQIIQIEAQPQTINYRENDLNILCSIFNPTKLNAVFSYSNWKTLVQYLRLLYQKPLHKHHRLSGMTTHYKTEPLSLGTLTLQALHS